MTTEVQTVEAGEAPAVPAATPTCSADYPATAATRRLKRAGPSTTEAADIKRPRTAPATPIDNITNAGNPPVGKLTVFDSDSRLGIQADSHNLNHTSRPSATASAPAALNRALRSQPSVSTSPPSTTPGSCSANGTSIAQAAANRHCGAISGVLTASQQQPQQPQQQQRQSAEDGLSLGVCMDQQQAGQQHSAPPSSSLPLQLLPALHRVGPAAAAATPSTPGGGGGAAAAAAATGGENLVPRGSGGTRNSHHHHHHSQQTHSYSHHGQESPQVLPLQQHPHHRHDALEEQVFSPAFHRPNSVSLPSSAQPSPAGSPHHAVPKAPPGGEASAAAATEAQLGVAVAAADAAVKVGVEVVLTHNHAPTCTQLHAIDLNVVDGVDVDTEDDELEAATAATASAAAGEEGAAAAGQGDGAAAAATVTATVAAAGVTLLRKGVTVVRGQQLLNRGQEPGQEESVMRTAGSVGADPVSELPSGATERGPKQHQHQQQKPDRKARDQEDGGSSRTSSISGGAIEAVGEELSSSSDGSEEAGGGGGRGDGEDGDEDGDFYECENDENAPMARCAAAAPPAIPIRARAAAVATAAAHQRTSTSDQQQQQHDAVLVASAPRGLAAAVSAVLPTAAVAGAAAAAVSAVQAQQQQQQQQEDDEDDEEDEDEALLEFDPLVFIKQLPPLESCVSAHRPVLLPLQTRTMARRKTLVLDLDETLVHSSLEAVDRSDFSFPVVFNGTEHQVYVRQRPHLRDFMVRVSALFEVVVFTASQRIYAERLLDILDPQQQLVRHRIYRDSCVVVDGNYLKDLSILGRDLAHTVIVDNSPQAFGFQVDNGIPIESWYDDDDDVELIRLLPFLESLAGAEVEDVRPRIRSQFRLRELIDRA